MKKITALILAAAAAFSVTASAFAEAPSVYINDEKLTFPDAEPFIEEDRTLVPMRAIFEACGADIAWDQDTLTVLGSKKDKDVLSTVVLQINNTKAYVDGKETELDVPAKVVDDRTYVPLRFVSEALKAKVDWDESNMRIDITTTAE